MHAKISVLLFMDKKNVHIFFLHDVFLLINLYKKKFVENNFNLQTN